MKTLLYVATFVSTLIAGIWLDAHADNFTVQVPITITGATCTQAGNAFTCAGVTPPPTAVAVPNVVGYTQAIANSTLITAGLVLGGVTSQASSTPVGIVITQNPAAGTVVAGGTPVALVISSGSGAWSGVCPGFTYTRVLPVNWAAPVRMLTSAFGGFGASDIVVVQFTTGDSASTGNLLKITGAEYQGPPIQRTAALSDIPCDFTGGSLKAWWGSTTTGSTSVTVPFTIENPNNYGYYPILQRNTTYYLNVKQAPSSGCTASCDMFFELIKYNNV